MVESNERKKYHDLLQKLIVPDGGLIYDIGVSSRFDYSDWFPHCHVVTVDRDPSKKPGIVCDRLPENCTS